MATPGQVTVVGLGADGWAGLPARSRQLLADAEVLLGGSRHLALVPLSGGQIRAPWPSPLRANLLALLEEHSDRRVVAMASGDPMVSGIGTTLIDLLGPDRVRVEPHVSSVALARARMGWAAESCAVVSLVGRDAHAVLRELAPGRRVLALSSDETTPAEVAALLTSTGYGDSSVTVLGNLGADSESRVVHVARDFAGESARLNVIALDLIGPLTGGWTAGLPDDAFENDGQLTKRDLRASALSRLAPHPGHVLWDVGAGAGSVGIEWMRSHHSTRTFAIEGNPERAARIGRNAASLGVPQLQVVLGRVPDALAGLTIPDAVFIGGGATVPGVIEACVEALVSGGRLVAHGVTLETEQVLARWFADLGGELTRIHVEQTAPIGGFTGWTPARAVTQWSWRKP